MQKSANRISMAAWKWIPAQEITGDTLEKVKGKKIKVIIFVDQTVVVFSESHNTPPKASA